MEGGTTARTPYTPEHFDEAIDADGELRGHYAELLPALEELDLDRAAAQIREHLDEQGVDFKGDEGQRAAALNAFIKDVYSEQLIAREGVVPARLIETSENLEAEMVGVEVRGPYAPVIGFDIVRGEDGRFRILEDNCMNPSGIAYALAARTSIDAFVPLQPPAERRDIAHAVELLGNVLRAAAPEETEEPTAALISEGEENGAWYEHVALSKRLGVPIIDPEDLEIRKGRLYGAPAGGRPVELDVIYLRDQRS